MKSYLKYLFVMLFIAALLGLSFVLITFRAQIYQTNSNYNIVLYTISFTSILQFVGLSSLVGIVYIKLLEKKSKE